VTRVVADTNVFISGLLFGGLPKSFLDLAFLGGFQLVTSDVLLDELEEKLLGKFRMSEPRVRQARQAFARHSTIVTPQIRLAVVHDDPDDDRVLECAIAGEAEFIVTGDRHLLRISTFHEIEIVTVREFMDSFAARV
jgi:putative PIN family toxin of toxin-antitoxin system